MISASGSIVNPEHSSFFNKTFTQRLISKLEFTHSKEMKMSEVLDRPVKTKTLTLGAAIDKMWQLREDKKAANKVVDNIAAEIATLEIKMFDLLDAQDTRKAEGKKASVSISSVISANVEDWDQLWPFITKNKYFHLVQKRVSDPGMRELWEQGKRTPGVAQFTKRTLNIRSL